MTEAWLCARCGTELRGGTYQGVPVSQCPACEALLVQLRYNVPLLEALARTVAADVHAESHVAPHPGATADAHCPSCRQKMERFGYMGTNAVFFDRCRGCELVHIDGDEVRTAAAVYARTERRGQVRRESQGLAPPPPLDRDEQLARTMAKLELLPALPPTCPNCRAPVSRADVRVLDDGTAHCRYCDARLEGRAGA